MIRKVIRDDFEILFLWRNDDEVVKNSRYQNHISREEFEEWFEERIENKKIHMFILEKGKEKIGQIKIEPSANELLITYSVAKEYRKKGFGKRLVIDLEEYIKENKELFMEYDELVAYINAKNCSSISVFKSLNFYLKEGNEYYVKYARKIN